jgi:membrane fusion protein, multidrug efflux system
MTSLHHSKLITLIAALLAAFVLAAPARSAEPFFPNGVTKPTQRVEMAVPVMGQVREVKVKPGDMVKAGQLLVQLDDTVEHKRAEALKVDAESDVQMRAAEAELAQKTVERDRKVNSEGFSLSEKEEAKLAVTVAGLRVELAKQDKLKKLAELQVQEQLIERMKLLSPVSGIIEKVDADVGEVADPSKPALVVVDNSKIDVEASLPTAQVNKLKLGDVVEVRYGEGSETRQAKIIYLAPVADAASDTRLLRAQMDNPDGRPTGISVAVKIIEKTGTAQADQ